MEVRYVRLSRSFHTQVFRPRHKSQVTLAASASNAAIARFPSRDAKCRGEANYNISSMIALPVRQKLISKRDNLYIRLYSIIHIADIHQVEAIMRQIHTINLRLLIYYKEQGRTVKNKFNTY